MDHAQFRIGVEFAYGGGVWRCTDIGTRIIAAIRVDRVEKVSTKGDDITIVPLSRSQADEERWFSGPPYAVAEIVFDEDCIELCQPIG